MMIFAQKNVAKCFLESFVLLVRCLSLPFTKLGLPISQCFPAGGLAWCPHAPISARAREDRWETEERETAGLQGF